METNQFNIDIAVSLLKLAGFKVNVNAFIYDQFYKLYNQYDRLRHDPWFIIQTNIGPIIMGYRKHVFNIDWRFTSIRGEVTQDDVTKDSYFVHAWTEQKTLEYLTNLNLLYLNSNKTEN